MSMSRTTGKFKVVENGEVLADKYADEIVKVMEQVPVQVIGQLSIIQANLWACDHTRLGKRISPNTTEIYNCVV